MEIDTKQTDTIGVLRASVIVAVLVEQGYSLKEAVEKVYGDLGVASGE